MLTSPAGAVGGWSSDSGGPCHVSHAFSVPWLGFSALAVWAPQLPLMCIPDILSPL